MKKRLLTILLWLFIVIEISGCSKSKQNDNNERNDQINQQEILSCLENELGSYIVTENATLKNLPLKEITDKEDKIAYYKGYVADANNMYVIYTGTITYEYDVMKDFDLYFSEKFPVYQKYLFNNGIYILIHNTFNDIDFNALKKNCNKNSLEKENIKNIPSNILNKIEKTNKIVIKSGTSELGVITNKDKIANILDIVSKAEQYSIRGSEVAYLCDGSAFTFEMYKDNKLIETINIWYDGNRIMPESISGGCDYYTLPNEVTDFREIIENETDYLFYGISDYDLDCVSDKELIYEDDNYRYYLECQKSDKVLINFNLSNITMTLKDALNNGYINPKQMEADAILKKEAKTK